MTSTATALGAGSTSPITSRQHRGNHPGFSPRSSPLVTFSRRSTTSPPPCSPGMQVLPAQKQGRELKTRLSRQGVPRKACEEEEEEEDLHRIPPRCFPAGSRAADRSRASPPAGINPWGGRGGIPGAIAPRHPHGSYKSSLETSRKGEAATTRAPQPSGEGCWKPERSGRQGGSERAGGGAHASRPALTADTRA